MCEYAHRCQHECCDGSRAWFCGEFAEFQEGGKWYCAPHVPSGFAAHMEQCREREWEEEKRQAAIAEVARLRGEGE